MPEGNKLAKLIVQRKRQERKNDQLRLRKNRIANDRLKVETNYFEWQKQIRQREFQAREHGYMRKLERIYERQLHIQDKRRKEEEEVLEVQQRRDERRNNVAANTERQERERVRLLSGIKQERAKTFMSKARLLSSGYRDNDPPLTYYKRNGLVPPDRMVPPEMRANAQASFGGGVRPPPSSDHLRKSMLPRETAYGVTDPDQHRRASDSARSRMSSTASKSDLMSIATTDDVAHDDLLIDEVMRVQVNVRPSTAPGKRVSKRDSSQRLVRQGIVTEMDENDDAGEASADASETDKDIETRRPATATGTVRFTEHQDTVRDGQAEPTRASGHVRGRRRNSMRGPHVMMFRRRSGQSVGSSPPNSSRRSVASSPRSRRGGKAENEQQLMTNVEQERIRQKMLEKARCLSSERTKRAMSGGDPPKARRAASAGATNSIPAFEAWRARNRVEGFATVEHVTRSRTKNQMQTMIDYIARCERGEIMGETAEAQRILLRNTIRDLRNLHDDVGEFVRS